MAIYRDGDRVERLRASDLFALADSNFDQGRYERCRLFSSPDIITRDDPDDFRYRAMLRILNETSLACLSNEKGEYEGHALRALEMSETSHSSGDIGNIDFMRIRNSKLNAMREIGEEKFGRSSDDLSNAYESVEARYAMCSQVAIIESRNKAIISSRNRRPDIST